MNQQHGRRRVVLGTVGAALGLVGISGSTRAKSAQNTFVSDCRKSGGTPSRVGTRVVRCNHTEYDTTCNFNATPSRLQGQNSLATRLHGVAAASVGIRCHPWIELGPRLRAQLSS